MTVVHPNKISGRSKRSTTWPLLALLCLAASCQKQNIIINGTTLPVLVDAGRISGAVIPIDVPDGLQALRNFFQTRGVVTLSINADEINLGDSLQLFNDTTNTNLVDAPAGTLGLLDGATGRAGDVHYTALSDGYKFTLQIYPTDPSNAGKFSYGANNLRLVGGASAEPVEAKSQVTLHDFSFVTMGFSAFAEPVQRAGGWQAQVDYMTSPVVTSDTSQMATGAIGLFNW